MPLPTFAGREFKKLPDEPQLNPLIADRMRNRRPHHIEVVDTELLLDIPDFFISVLE